MLLVGGGGLDGHRTSLKLGYKIHQPPLRKVHAARFLLPQAFRQQPPDADANQPVRQQVPLQ